MLTRLLLVLGLVAMPVIASAEIKYGLWSFDTDMTMPNMPKMPANMPKLPAGVKLPEGMSMPQFSPEGMKMTFQHCVTKEQLIPKNNHSKEDCQVKNMEVKGDTVNATMLCNTPEGQLQAKFAATYSGDTMKSTMDMTGTAHNQPIQMHQETTGKYLGTCKK